MTDVNGVPQNLGTLGASGTGSLNTPNYPLSYSQGQQPVGPYPFDLIESYHRYTLLSRPNTQANFDLGIYDGRQALWIDGVKVIDMARRRSASFRRADTRTGVHFSISPTLSEKRICWTS